MKKLARLLAGVLCFSMLITAAGCKDKHQDTSSSTPDSESLSDSTAEVTVETEAVIDPNTIYWVADYDLNPAPGQERSTALALFEQQYNAKVEWVQANAENKYDILMQRVNSSEPVDMFPFDLNTMPDGVSRELFDPLDDYLDLKDPIWDDMRGAIDMFAYSGKHYIVPYSVSDPLLITYSRKLCKENGLDSKADEGAIEAVIEKVIAENPKAVEDFKNGKVKAKQALFGACMKELKGTANTDVIRELLDKKMERI